jgi:signal transduction histidine kinase
VLLFPAVLFCVALGALIYTFLSQMRAQEQYDQAALREWFEESRVFRDTLARLVREYVDSPADAAEDRAEKVRKHLSVLGDMTREYQGQLPLFPVLYSMEVELKQSRGEQIAQQVAQPLGWDSHLPRRKGTMPWLAVTLRDGQQEVGTLRVCYQLHAYNKQQEAAQERQALLRWLSILAGGIALAAIGWGYIFLRRDRQREVKRLLAEHQVEHAEKLLLENQLHRQDVEQQKNVIERKFLEQRVATEEAERKALEMRSQLYANVGIMAGSYAHNIKNLLVRPNDLIRRCLEVDGLQSDQRHMLGEVNETLHTVTERLQQILKTVRRDPTRSELSAVDLNDIAREIVASWQPMAADKWKLTLCSQIWPEPLVIRADRSHLMQAVENLVFNARDATYEMRNQVRDQARRESDLDGEQKRAALIAAAGWRGEITVRTALQGSEAVLEVLDNGIGMSEETRRRCTETHFSTKRNNALFEGDTTGMGLGLSFVQTILEAHSARMDIESHLLQGAQFRLNFPLKDSISAAPHLAQA